MAELIGKSVAEPAAIVGNVNDALAQIMREPIGLGRNTVTVLA
jgi:hypothetical protein